MSTEHIHKPAAPLPRRWLNVSEAADYLRCSLNMLNKDRCHRLLGIPFTTCGRRVLYDANELDAYLEQRKQC